MSQQQLATLAKLRAEKDAAAKAAAELWHAALRGDAVAVEHVLHDTPGMTEDTSQSVSAAPRAFFFYFICARHSQHVRALGRSWSGRL